MALGNYCRGECTLTSNEIIKQCSVRWIQWLNWKLKLRKHLAFSFGIKHKLSSKYFLFKLSGVLGAFCRQLVEFLLVLSYETWVKNLSSLRLLPKNQFTNSPRFSFHTWLYDHPRAQGPFTFGENGRCSLPEKLTWNYQNAENGRCSLWKGSGWWFQPISKILVKLDHVPR